MAINAEHFAYESDYDAQRAFRALENDTERLLSVFMTQRSMSRKLDTHTDKLERLNGVDRKIEDHLKEHHDLKVGAAAVKQWMTTVREWGSKITVVVGAIIMLVGGPHVVEQLTNIAKALWS